MKLEIDTRNTSKAFVIVIKKYALDKTIRKPRLWTTYATWFEAYARVDNIMLNESWPKFAKIVKEDVGF